MESPENTVNGVIQFFERLVTDFTWRRLVFIAVLLALVASAFATYEFYTRSFVLARLDREVTLLERVLTLDESTEDVTDENILESLDGIKSRLLDLSVAKETVMPVSRGTSKVFYSVAPWVVLALVLLLVGGEGGGSSIVGILVFALPLVLLNVFIPDFKYLWTNNWLIPWGELALVLTFVIRWQKRRDRRAAA